MTADPETKTRMAQLGMTMIIVTHEIQFARQVADTVAVMADGVIIEKGPAGEILTRPQDPRTRRFLANPCRSRTDAEAPRQSLPAAIAVRRQSVSGELTCRK